MAEPFKNTPPAPENKGEMTAQNIAAALAGERGGDVLGRHLTLVLGGGRSVLERLGHLGVPLLVGVAGGCRRSHGIDGRRTSMLTARTVVKPLSRQHAAA